MQILFMQLEDEVIEENEEDRALRNLFITNKLVEIMLVLMRYEKKTKKKWETIDMKFFLHCIHILMNG